MEKCLFSDQRPPPHLSTLETTGLQQPALLRGRPPMVLEEGESTGGVWGTKSPQQKDLEPVTRAPRALEADPLAGASPGALKRLQR